MAVVVTPAYNNGQFKTWTVAADAADAIDSAAATTHGFVSAPGTAATPVDVVVTDTTPGATVLGNPFIVHSIGATTFRVRKAVATVENRTALVIARLPHSIDA